MNSINEKGVVPGKSKEKSVNGDSGEACSAVYDNDSGTGSVSNIAESTARASSGYADLIIHSFLKLQEGDSLSINTDEEDFSFAREIANKALKTTKVQVKIVVIKNGRPVDVIEFDPELTDIKATENVFLRISHEDRNSDNGIPVRESCEAGTENELIDAPAQIVPVKNDGVQIMPLEREDGFETQLSEISALDFRTLQLLGHVAEPVVLNRRIGIPYCVVPSLPKKYDYSVDKEITNIDYITDFLNHLDADELHFVDKESGTDLKVIVPDEVMFTNHHSKLSYGRDFVNSADFRRVKCTLDALSAEGRLTGSATVLGKKQDVELFFEQGKVVSYKPSAELDRLFSFDENLKRAGYLELKDGRICIYLGGALLESLRDEPETEEEIPSFFNTSVYSLCIELPPAVNIEATLCGGDKLEIVRSGYIIV